MNVVLSGSIHFYLKKDFILGVLTEGDRLFGVIKSNYFLIFYLYLAIQKGTKLSVNCFWWW